jgi:hypothetical protein
VQSAFVTFAQVSFFRAFVAKRLCVLGGLRPRERTSPPPPFVAAEFLAFFECVATA